MFRFFTFDVFWPVTNADFGVEKKSIRAKLLVPPDTVGALVKSVAHSGDGVDTVFTVFWLIIAFNISRRLATFSFFRK